MASSSKQKTTMAKLQRERAVRERRELKQANKRAKNDARRRETETPADSQQRLVEEV